MQNSFVVWKVGVHLWGQTNTETMENFTFIGSEMPTKDYEVIGVMTKEAECDFDGNVSFYPSLEFIRDEDGDCVTDAEVDMLYEMNKGKQACNCNHCGSHMKWFHIIRNVNTKAVHIIGKTCGSALARFTETDAYSDAKTLSSKRAAELKSIAIKLQKQIQSVLDANAGLADALDVKHSILSDMKDKLYKYGNLSEKQIAFALKLSKEHLAKMETSKPAFTNGSKVSTNATASKVKVWDGEFGKSYFVLFTCEDGSVFMYKGGVQFYEGTAYKIDGTIQNREYNGLTNSFVTRPKYAKIN